MNADDANDNLTVATCPHCRHRVRIVNPAGGDGTARLFVRHPPRSTSSCPGSRTEVRL